MLKGIEDAARNVKMLSTVFNPHLDNSRQIASSLQLMIEGWNVVKPTQESSRAPDTGSSTTSNPVSCVGGKRNYDFLAPPPTNSLFGKKSKPTDATANLHSLPRRMMDVIDRSDRDQQTILRVAQSCLKAYRALDSKWSLLRARCFNAQGKLVNVDCLCRFLEEAGVPLGGLDEVSFEHIPNLMEELKVEALDGYVDLQAVTSLQTSSRVQNEMFNFWLLNQPYTLQQKLSKDPKKREMLETISRARWGANDAKHPIISKWLWDIEEAASNITASAIYLFQLEGLRQAASSLQEMMKQVEKVKIQREKSRVLQN